MKRLSFGAALGVAFALFSTVGALAQSATQVPYGTITDKSGRPVAITAAILTGYDSSTHLPCIIGTGATCQLQTNATGGVGGSLSATAHATAPSDLTEGQTSAGLVVDLSHHLFTRAMQDGAWNVGITGALPGFATPPSIAVPDGSDVTLGSKADGACASDTGSCSTQEMLKRLAQQMTALQAKIDTLNTSATSPLPAGSNLVGKFGVDQTTDGITNAVSAHGAETQGAAVTGGMFRTACRAATAAPTAVADGQAVDPMCSKHGKVVTAPYASDDLSQRGAAASTATTAQTFTGWSTPGASAYAYITAVQCFRTDAGTSLVYVTLNDSASTRIPVPAGTGAAPPFPTPLKTTSAATAPAFTPSAATTTLYCNAQGYNQ